MRKAACLVGVLALTLAASLEARGENLLYSYLAGDVEVEGYPKITIGGEVDLRGVWRSDDMLDLNFGALRKAPIAPGRTKRGGEWFVDPDLTLQIDVQNLASPLWNARVALKTPQWVIDDFGSQVRNVDVKELWLEAPELATEKLSLRLGIMDYSIDVRGNGESFLFHPYESESAFLRRFGNSAGNPLTIPLGNGAVIPTPVSGTGTGASKAAFATGVGPGSSTGEANTLETAGVLATLGFPEVNLSFDLFWFNLVEVRELGSPNDEVAWGTVGRFDLGERGGLHALFMAFETSRTTRIYNIGLGASVLPLVDDTSELEAYGEYIYQWGVFDRNLAALAGPGGSPNDLKQSSSAFYVGARYKLKSANWKPGIDASIWHIQGDRDSGSKTNNDFVSYEDIDSTLIVEENNYGLDIDSNYEALKLRFDLGWDWNDQDDIPEDISFYILYAYFQLQEGQGLPGGGQTRKKIGDEIDIGVVWNYSPNLSFFAAGGWLFDMKAFNDAQRFVGEDPVDGNSLGMLMLGTTLRF